MRLNLLTLFKFGMFGLLTVCLHAQAGQDSEFQAAKGYYTLGEYKDAVTKFEKFIADYPKAERVEDAQLLLAESEYQLKDYAKASQAYGAFVEAYPKSTHRGDALIRAVKAAAAINDFKTCQKYAEAFVQENREAVAAALKEEAQAPPNQAAKQNPLLVKYATALYHAGDSSYALKDVAKAQANWEELLKTLPSSPLVPDASDGLGWIYFDVKKYDDAAAKFHIVAQVANHPRAAWARLMEGRALAALKKTDEALAAFKQAPTLSGANNELMAESALRTAELLLGAERVADAMEFYRALIKVAPTAPATQAALSAAAGKAFDLKSYAEAAELGGLYLTASEAEAGKAPNRSTVARLRARAFHELKKNDEALAAANEAVTEAEKATDPERKRNDAPAALLLKAELDEKQRAVIYKQVAETYAGSRYALSAEYELARMAAEARDLSGALQHAETLLKQFENEKEADPALTQLKHDGLFAAGEFAFQLKDYGKAANYLGAYLKAYNDTDARADDVTSKLAWSLHESGKEEASAQTVDHALAAFTKSGLRAELLYLRALVAEKLKQPDDVIKFDEQLIKEGADSEYAAPALYDAAAHYYAAQKFDAAQGHLDTMLARKELKDELRNRALQLRATILLNAGKVAAAQADADELLKAPGTDSKLNYPAIRLIKALALASQPEKQSEALTALNEVIAQSPATAPEAHQALLRRAYVLFKEKKFADAKLDFVKLAAVGADGKFTPETLDAALHLALIQRELKENDAAKALLQKIVQQSDVKLSGVAAFEAPFQLANLLFEGGDNAGALKQYDRALENVSATLPPETVSAARLNRAWTLRRLKDNDKAADAFAEVAKEDPSGHFTAEALLERARILVELGKRADALPALKELLDRFKDAPQAEAALFLKARSEAHAGQFKEAAESFEAYAQKYTTPAGREALCGLGEARLQLKENDKAKEAFTKALGAKGVDAELDDVVERALLGLADISLKQADSAGAKRLALRILAEDPKSDWADAAYFIAGQCSEGLKEPEKAIGYYRKLIAEKPTSSHVPAAEERLRALGAPK